MALNNSGPISMGGPIVGQSINLELGRSASTQSSLDENALRTLAGKPAGTINLTDFYGKYKVWNYVASYGNNNGTGFLHYATSVAISTGNIYVSGEKNASIHYIAKYDAKGDSVWRKIIESQRASYSCATDEAENIYSLTINRRLVKHTSNGDFVWSYFYNDNNLLLADTLMHIANNNIFIVGYGRTFNTFVNFIFLLKLDTDGNFVWQKIIGAGSPNSLFAYSITTGPDGSIYIGGDRREGLNSSPRAMIMKLTSTGSFVWCRYIENTEYPPGDYATGLGINAIRTDSFGNVYAVGFFRNDITEPVRSNASGIWKFNSSGSLLWQRILGTDAVGIDINLDSVGNIYVISRARNPITSYYDIALIANISDTGNLIWQKSLYANIIGSNPNIRSIKSQIIEDSRYGSYFYGVFGSRSAFGSPVQAYGGLFSLSTDPNFTVNLPLVTYNTFSDEFITLPAKFANTSATYAATNASFTRSSEPTTVVDITDNTDKTVIFIS